MHYGRQNEYSGTLGYAVDFSTLAKKKDNSV